MESERNVRTFCRVCEPACGLVAEVRDGQLERLRPDREHPVTKGFACNKGLAGVEINRDPDRLGHPQIRRQDGSFERVGWDEAIDDIARRLGTILSEHGPNAVAAYTGNPSYFSAMTVASARAFYGQLGVRRRFDAATQDCANKGAAVQAVYGSSTLNTHPDFEHADVLCIFGSNPRVSHMTILSVPDPMRLLKDARDRGAKIYVVDPRETETVQSGVGELVQIRPDTDLYLMAALLHELDRLGAWDEDVLRAHGKNVSQLRRFVAKFPVDRASRVTGIGAETIESMAQEIARSRSAAFYMSTGVNMGRQGTLAHWLMQMLSFVTGNLDRSGGNLISPGVYGKNLKSGRADYATRFVDTEFGELYKGGMLPGTLLSHYILDAKEPVRALIVVAGNPILSIGGEARLREAFPELELLVCLDLYKNATGEYATHLLPCTDQFEREDLNTAGMGNQYKPWVQFTERVVPAAEERKEEWWIFARLSQAMGLNSILDSDDENARWGRIEHMLGTSGFTLEQVRAEPHGIALGSLEPGALFGGYLQTPDQKVDCCPAAFSNALVRAEALYDELVSEKRGQLKLIGKRDVYSHNSWYANVASMKRGERDRNYLFVHPEDAAERGIDEGSLVRCWNANGEILVDTKFDAGLLRGVCALSHGWGNQGATGMRVAARSPGVNPNVLRPIGPQSFERLSNQAFMTGLPIEIERA